MENCLGRRQILLPLCNCCSLRRTSHAGILLYTELPATAGNALRCSRLGQHPRACPPFRCSTLPCKALAALVPSKTPCLAPRGWACAAAEGARCQAWLHSPTRLLRILSNHTVLSRACMPGPVDEILIASPQFVKLCGEQSDRQGAVAVGTRPQDRPRHGGRRYGAECKEELYLHARLGLAHHESLKPARPELLAASLHLCSTLGCAWLASLATAAHTGSPGTVQARARQRQGLAHPELEGTERRPLQLCAEVRKANEVRQHALHAPVCSE